MAHPPQPYDLVIIGASFAGLAAAKTAAMRGLKVAVLDAKPGPEHRVATTGILVQEAAEEFDVPHSLTRRVHGVRLYAPNLKHVDLFAPGSFFLTTEPGRLLNWLAQEAMRAGAHLLWRQPFTGAERQGGIFTFSGVNISARHILGADGARSAVARHFGLGRNRRFLAAIEAQFDDLEGADTRFLHCFLDSGIAPGHIAWVVPGPSAFHAWPCRCSGAPPASQGVPQEVRAHLRLRKRKGDWAHARAHSLRRPGHALGHSRRDADRRRGGHGFAGNGRRHPLCAPLRAAIRPARGRSPSAFRAASGDRAGAGAARLRGSISVLRAGLNLAPPNILLSAAFGTPAIRWLARHIYFRSRGGQGVSFADFEARLAGLESKDGAAATGVFR